MRTAFRSLAVLTLVLVGVVVAQPSEARTVYSAHGKSFSWNDFSVLNNQWGRDYAKSGWYQRIVREENQTISFEYNWWGSTSEVKGYPAIIAGWHYGDPGGYMTQHQSKDLPVKISAERVFNTGINATHINRNNGYEKMNVSWDIWVAWSDRPSVPGNEIMIWPWNKNQRPIGSKVETVSIWNTAWDLYSGWQTVDSNRWCVFTFVRQSNTLNTSGNLRDFINYIWKTKGWLKGDQWIVGIECGTEIMEGKGSWNISRYWLNPAGPKAPGGLRIVNVSDSRRRGRP
jgi:hypothetical protein